MQLDLHGKTVVEAQNELEYFLYKAHLEQESLVKVVTGWGEGRLYLSIEKFLKQHPLVKNVKKPLNTNEAAFWVEVE